jgi:hypothetical protein
MRHTARPQTYTHTPLMTAQLSGLAPFGMRRRALSRTCVPSDDDAAGPLALWDVVFDQLTWLERVDRRRWRSCATPTGRCRPCRRQPEGLGVPLRPTVDVVDDRPERQALNLHLRLRGGNRQPRRSGAHAGVRDEPYDVVAGSQPWRSGQISAASHASRCTADGPEDHRVGVDPVCVGVAERALGT